MTRKEKLLGFLKENSQPLLAEEIAAMLGVSGEDVAELTGLLAECEAEGSIIKTKRDRYVSSEKMGYVLGHLSVSEKGFGFLVPDDAEKDDVFIAANDLNGAMHKDRVLIRVVKKSADETRSEGEVVRIIERGYSAIVGRFELSDGFGFVSPDEKRINYDIFVPFKYALNAQTGEKVVVTITKYPEGHRNPEGRIVERLGFETEPGIDVLSVIRRFELKDTFDEDTLAEARQMPTTIPEEEIKARRDFRNLTIITIDGDDAKDLDDAVHVEKMENGHIRLGVHIADVTNYVKQNSPLDREAFERGTSVYLEDRVIPMLPVELSNGICSLNPQVDRLTLSVLMEIDENGNVVDHEICEGVIRTTERMTYHNVTAILQEEDPQLMEQYAHIKEDLHLMLTLALILRKKRINRGAIDFDFPEAKAILNEKGEPVDIQKYEVGVSNRIIEEFMLVCNETVAEHAFWANLPFVYRVHETPSEDKISDFAKFIYNLGYILKPPYHDIHPKSLQKVVDKIKGTPQDKMISTAMLRSLMKAIYSPYNEGHFALASKYYAHFTSPIRRYPDLCIHRILKKTLHGGFSESEFEKMQEFVKEAANQSSERERQAEDAEREVFKLKAAEYMMNHIGEEFTGVVSSVTNFGMFIELDNTIEGLVRMANLDDDYYIYDEKNYCLVGEHTHHMYTIGDEVKVLVVNADQESRQVDFVLANASEQTKHNEYRRYQKKASFKKPTPLAAAKKGVRGSASSKKRPTKGKRNFKKAGQKRNSR